jgi:hypothetical protein
MDGWIDKWRGSDILAWGVKFIKKLWINIK